MKIGAEPLAELRRPGPPDTAGRRSSVCVPTFVVGETAAAAYFNAPAPIRLRISPGSGSYHPFRVVATGLVRGLVLTGQQHRQLLVELPWSSRGWERLARLAAILESTCSRFRGRDRGCGLHQHSVAHLDPDLPLYLTPPGDAQRLSRFPDVSSRKVSHNLSSPSLIAA